MESTNNTTSKASKLRQQAEALLKSQLKKGNLPSSEADILKLIHELQVHQIELELQNEELYQTNQELIAANENADDNITKLKTELKFIESIFDTQSDTIFVFNPLNGKAIRWNKSFENISGYSGEEISKMKAPDSYYSIEDIAKAYDYFPEILKQGKGRVELELICKNGRKIQTEYAVSIIFDDFGIAKEFISIGRDITERKKAEKELLLSKEKSEENERLMRKIAENFPNSFISIIESDLTVGFSAGQEFTRININPQIFVGLTLEQAFGEYSAVVKKHYLETFRGKETTFELLINDQYVKNQFYLYKTVPLFDEKNEISRILVVAENISERRLADDALKESESRFKNMFEGHNAIMLLINPESGKIIGANDASARFYGYSRDELLSMRIDEINVLSPEQIKMELEHAIHQKRNYFVFPHRLANGEVRTVEVHSSPINYQDKQILFSIIHDITEPRLAEEKLKESELKYRSLIESSSDAIFCVDEKGEYKFTNHLFASTFGKTPEYFIGKTFWDVYDKEHADYRYEATKRLFQTGKSESLEVEVPLPDKTLYFLATTNPIKDESGKVILNLTHAADITRIKQTERLLQEKTEKIVAQNEELQKLNAAKDKFFSIIAHDLKSPFNSILGFSELLVERISEKDYDGIEKYSGIILQSSQRAVDLLMNLMEWSRSQTGRIEFNPERFDFSEFINEITLLFDDIARQKEIVIKRETPPNTLVFADPAMINTVMRNLISNAIKFTKPDGQIIITVTGKPQEINVSVKDSGIGISAERKDKLFRLDESYSTPGTNNEKGTGLGLILCKEFVEKHGGTIWVESEPGKGSVFSFSIPLIK